MDFDKIEKEYLEHLARIESTGFVIPEYNYMRDTTNSFKIKIRLLSCITNSMCTEIEYALLQNHSTQKIHKSSKDNFINFRNSIINLSYSKKQEEVINIFKDFQLFTERVADFD